MPRLTEVFQVKEGPDQVNPKVEKLMSSSEVSQFVEDDWLALGLMALDQAGLPLTVQNKIEKMANEAMPSSVGAQAARDQERNPNDQAH